jgi:DNA-binding response OmpR family regulator
MLRSRESSVNYSKLLRSQSLHQNVVLSALEFRLLHYLASHPGMVFSRDQLLDRIWGDNRTVTLRASMYTCGAAVRKLKIIPRRWSTYKLSTALGIGLRDKRTDSSFSLPTDPTPASSSTIAWGR